MSGRSRAVAIQAVGVAILGAIIYLAFLRPSEPDPLSGIKGPEAQQASRDPGSKGPGAKKPSHGSKQQGRQDGTGRPGTGPYVGPGLGNEPGGTAPNGATPQVPGTQGDLEPPEGSGPDGNPETPPDDQYSDTMARILSRIGE